MSEKPVFFNSQGLLIEGLIQESSGSRAVAVTHPHPLYGGDMHNHVVFGMVSAYEQKGYTTLRFNFRGVGKSEGRHDQGRGEQEDVKAALAYLKELGKSSLDLAGYSFGSWVIAKGLASTEQVKRVVMVSPPVSFLDFSFLRYDPRIELVITGAEDTFASPSLIKERLAVWNPRAVCRIIQGEDHFFGQGAFEITKIIKTHLDEPVPGSGDRF